MSTEDQQNLLDEATRALRESPVPSGPPAQLVAATREAISSAGEAEPDLRSNLFRPRGWRPLLSVAAALLLLIGLGALVMIQGERNLAHADVQRLFSEAQTIQFEALTSDTPDGEDLSRICRIKLKGSGLMRIETTGGPVTIIDFNQGKMLSLFPQAQTAIETDLSNKPDFLTPTNLLAELRQIMAGPAQPLGQKLDGQRRLEGFRFSGEHNRATEVWVDARDAAAVRVELIGATGRPVMICRDMVINESIDDAQFSLVPPAGYRLHKSDAAVTVVRRWPLEQDLVTGLLESARSNGGRFPASLDGAVHRLATQTSQSPAARGRVLRRIEAIGLAAAFEGVMSQSAYCYAGHDIKLGDVQRPVCWWKTGQGTYRIIWGDLSATEQPNPPTTQPR